MGRGAGRLLRCMLEKVCIATNGLLKVILVRIWREKRRVYYSLFWRTGDHRTVPRKLVSLVLSTIFGCENPASSLYLQTAQ